MMASKNKQFMASIILSLAVITYVLMKLDWQAAIDTFTHLNWVWLVLAFGVYLVNYCLRTIRFQVLLNKKYISFKKLFGVTNLYGMYLYLMPAKSGELSYPILLKHNLKISLASSAAALIAARFFDFVTIALFLPAVLVVFGEQMPTWIRNSAMIFSLVVFMFGGISIWWLRRSDEFISSPRQIASSNRAFDRARRTLYKLYSSLQSIDQECKYWQIWLITVSIWFCVQVNFYLVVLSLGYKLTFFQILVVSVIMVPMTLLPVQGFANLGTHEVGWVTALTLFQQSQTTSLNIAVGSHIILLLFVLLLGLLGYVLLKGTSDVQDVIVQA